MAKLIPKPMEEMVINVRRRFRQMLLQASRLTIRLIGQFL
jgi:hypothetical protein